MTRSIDLFEKALQAPTMEAVIALSERVQTLEANPEGVVYTAYRAIDQTLLIGYTETLSASTTEHQQRGFELMEARRGTRREERLLLPPSSRWRRAVPGRHTQPSPRARTPRGRR